MYIYIYICVCVKYLYSISVYFLQMCLYYIWFVPASLLYVYVCLCESMSIYIVVMCIYIYTRTWDVFTINRFIYNVNPSFMILVDHFDYLEVFGITFVSQWQEYTGCWFSQTTCCWNITTFKVFKGKFTGKLGFEIFWMVKQDETGWNSGETVVWRPWFAYVCMVDAHVAGKWAPVWRLEASSWCWGAGVPWVWCLGGFC